LGTFGAIFSCFRCAARTVVENVRGGCGVHNVTRRACLKSNSIETHEKLRQRQGKLTSRWAKAMWDFWSVFTNFLAICQFVLAKVVSRASSHTCACVGNIPAFQKIHWKKIRRDQGPTHGTNFWQVMQNVRFVNYRMVVCSYWVRVVDGVPSKLFESSRGNQG